MNQYGIYEMHYYKFNIGDYASHTQHLEPLEDIAYRRMLDWIYLHESPLPDSPEQIARLIRMRTHCEDVANVLREFFTLTDHGWMQEKASVEIDAYKDKSTKAKASAAARWAKKPIEPNANALRPECEGNANHKPLTTNQEPLTNTKDMSTSSPVTQEKKVSKQFIKPTPEELVAHFESKGSTPSEAENFFNFYESKGWLVGKNKMKVWKASASLWIGKNKSNGQQVAINNNQSFDDALKRVF
jgi:uncharacterized protein YdaU (DUF1376 family)